MHILNINNIICILDLATLVPRTVWILASSITNRVCIVGITLANLLIRVWIVRARIHTTRVRTLASSTETKRKTSRLSSENLFSRASALTQLPIQSLSILLFGRGKFSLNGSIAFTISALNPFIPNTPDTTYLPRHNTQYVDDVPSICPDRLSICLREGLFPTLASTGLRFHATAII